MALFDKIASCGKPEPFALATLGGEVVHIHLLTPRQVAQWWTWVYEKPDQRRLYDEQLVELFRRCAVTDDDKPALTSEEFAKLRELPGAGKALAEFWTECKRRNFLYETAAEEERERNRFFTERATAGITAATDSPAGSPQQEANPIT